MSNALDFSGKVVVVSSGGTGTGSAIAQAFLGAGAAVVVCEHSQEPGLATSTGRELAYAGCDLSDYAQIETCIGQVAAHFGHIDVLVNAPGDVFPEDTNALSNGESIIRQRLVTALNFCQVANRVMQEQRDGGCIINVTRPGSAPGTPDRAARDAADAGVANLGTSLAVEWAPRVRINTLVMELTQTEQSTPRRGDAARDPGTSSTSTGDATDPGGACLFLASALASYVSGTSVSLPRAGAR